MRTAITCDSTVAARKGAERLTVPSSRGVTRECQLSMPNMTGRPGYRTMEMIGGSSAPYLTRTPCVPLFCTSFNRVGNKERFRLPGAGGGSFPLYGGTFARSYSVSKLGPKSFHNFSHLALFSHFFKIFPPGLSPSKQRVLAQ